MSINLSSTTLEICVSAVRLCMWMWLDISRTAGLVCNPHMI